MSELSRIDINSVNYDIKDAQARINADALQTQIAQEQTARLATSVVGGSYNSTNQTIELKNANNVVVASIDATPFIKDGMVSNVQVSNGNLVVSFNADANKQPISIPLTQFFNPNNYYNKQEIDTLIDTEASNRQQSENQILADSITSASYDSNQKLIKFFNKANTLISSIDATAFIKDGMVSSVTVSDGYLVISFNTDAGQSPIRIPLTDIFNPANYYTKTQVDTQINGLQLDDVTNQSLQTSEMSIALRKNGSNIDTIVIPSVTNEKAGLMSSQDKINLTNVSAKVDALASGVKVSISVSPNTIYKGTSQGITLTGTMTNGTPTSMKLMDGNTVLKETTTSPITHTYTTTLSSNTKTFQLIGVTTLGLSLNASASINARYPIYYGFGTTAISVAIDANKKAATTTAVSTYEKINNVGNGQYFYILVPSDISGLSTFTMGGAPFVMETLENQTINGIVYKVYRSGNTYNSGTKLTVVAS